MLDSLKISGKCLEGLRWVLISWLILGPAGSFAQPGTFSGDSAKYLVARIVDSVSREPVRFAHIVNTDMGLATVSDAMGYFYIKASKNDTIQISAIGYSITRLTLHESLLESRGIALIQLTPFIYPIDAVSVNQLGNYRQFRQRFLDLELPEPKYQISSSVLEDIGSGVDSITQLSPSPLGSPITYLYNLLSREGRSNRKLAKLQEEEEFARKIAYKYSPDLVSRITGYTGLELYEFMEFCNFTREFLLNSSEYEIIETILKTQKKFEE